MTPEDQSILSSLPLDQFFAAVKLSLWIVQSCEEHDLEMSYMDDELIVFKHKKPLSQKMKIE